MMISHPIRCITFDATNTLFHVKSSVGAQYRELLELYQPLQTNTHSSKLPSEFSLNKSFSRAFSHFGKLFPNFGHSTVQQSNSKVRSVTPKEWWRLVMSKTFALSGVEPFANSDQNSAFYWDDHIEQLFQQVHDKLFCSDKGWNVYPDVTVLERLRSQNPDCVIGVLSNADNRLSLILSSLGISRPFEYDSESFVIDSYSTGYEKPDPEIFEIALNRAEDLAQLHIPFHTSQITPQNCLHIGDSYERDYLGATEAGWHALLLDRDFSQIDKDTNDCTIHTLEDIPEKFGLAL